MIAGTHIDQTTARSSGPGDQLPATLPTGGGYAEPDEKESVKIDPAAPNIGLRCSSDIDCPGDQGCVWAPDGTRRCQSSECDFETERTCPPGQVCRILNEAQSRPPIRKCVPIGRAKLGDSCSAFSVDPNAQCGRGELCIFSVCRTLCDPEDAGCADTESCVPSARGDGFGCQPNCEQSGCPRGLSCLGLGDISICVSMIGNNCIENKCASGEHCEVTIDDDKAESWCRRTCDSIIGHDCPDGSVCGMGVGGVSYCYAICDPFARPSDCSAGLTCVPVTEDAQFWGCR